MSEYHYKSGNLPDRYKHQLNGKSAQHNYKRSKQKQQSLLLPIIQGMLQAVIRKALKEIFKELKI